MSFNIRFSKEAAIDYSKLDGSSKILVDKALRKVSKNPLPQQEGGFGKPLGNFADSKLSGCYKIKLKAAGIRIVYKLIKIDEEMYIIVIGARKDDEVYKIANKRLKNDL